MRRRTVLLIVSLAVLLAAACDPLMNPIGDAPLRYRDPIFTTVTKTADITYGNAVNQAGVNQALKLDLYQPEGDTVTARPAIVWVHGGSFSFGDKTSAELVDQANTFAKLGYVNVSINYRLSPTSCLGTLTTECIIAVLQAREDAQTAIRYLRSEAATYRIDPTRIMIGGSSAGAITALNVGFQSDNPGAGDHQGYSSAVTAVQSLSGTIFNTGVIAGGTGDAPALLFHGSSDLIVPYALAQATANAATAANKTAILRTFDGQGHVPYSANRAQILQETRNFFYTAMDGFHAAR